MILSKALRAAAGNIAPAPPSTDPQFNYVSMLLHGDGTNGAQNNTFIDSSTNNFTITRNGNTTQGSLSPYGVLWSNYFDGSGDYLTVPDNAAFNFGSGDLTVEMWLYPTAPGQSGYTFIYTKPNGTGYSGVAIIQDPSSYAIKLYCSSTGSSWDLVNGATIGTLPANTWSHVAVSRSGANIRAFLNGILGSTTAISTSSLLSTTGAVHVGSSLGNTNTFFTGYFSNLRVVKGTALYTSAFTPSTTPLTAISGTSLLTCQSNRFIDNSANNFTITRNGDVQVTKEAPFLPTAAYSTSTIGGSGYFDGTGDYLSFANSAAFAFGTGNFTVEYWIYSNSFASAPTVVDNRSGVTSTNGYSDYFNTTGTFALYIGNTTIYTSASAIPTKTWAHIAVSRSGTSLRVFINGVQSGATVTNSTNLSDQFLLIGTNSGATNSFNGYVSNLRLVKGTAVYTTNFTPPTAPVTAISGTSLLLNFTNAGIFDNAAENNLETVGAAQISTSIKKYGTGSIYLNGGPYLTAQQSPNMILGAGDFTIEGWVYPTNNNFILIDFRPDSTNGAYPSVYCDNGTFGYYVSSTFRIRNGTVTLNAWQHIAVVRFSGTTTMYINGVSVGSFADSFNYIVGANRPVIGVNGYATYATTLNGYIDDLRVTKGYARYTANFTPPTAAFPNQ